MRLYRNSILAAIGLLLSMHLTGCGHIEANVPEQSTFKPFLVRDLNSYFTTALKSRSRSTMSCLERVQLKLALHSRSFTLGCAFSTGTNWSRRELSGLLPATRKSSKLQILLAKSKSRRIRK